VIDETLSPTWDELLIFEEVLVYGRREDIKANPPAVIIEIYDQDKVSLNACHGLAETKKVLEIKSSKLFFLIIFYLDG
jgi:hypothetical protein